MLSCPFNGPVFLVGRFLDKQSGSFKITGLQEMQPEEAPEEPSEGGPATPLPSATKIVAEVARYSLSVGEFFETRTWQCIAIRWCTSNFRRRYYSEWS